MYLVEKQLKPFSAAHRITNGYKGKCRHLHGHNYVGQLTIAADNLNDYGFVMDFSDINQYFDQWLSVHLDHSVLVSEDDATLLAFVQEEKQKYFLLPNGRTTSIEVLTEYLYREFESILQSVASECERRLTLFSVAINETSTSKAIYSPYMTA